jgi:hypothetical protein
VGGGLAVGTRFVDILGSFDPSGGMMPVPGALAHFSISAVYGIIFGLLWRLARGFRQTHFPGWLLGAVYSLVLFLLSYLIILPRGELNAAQFPVLQFLAAHLVYGLVLGHLTQEFSIGKHPR